MATSGYRAGVLTDDTQITYGKEATWGSKPGIAFTAIRYTSETLTQNRTRQRPTEISGTREAAAAITTQTTAAGTINFALSTGTMDDFFASCLQSDWTSDIAVDASDGDITLTVTGSSPSETIVLSSGTALKFDAITEKTWIRLLGFTNAGNNGWFFVSTKTSGTSLTLTTPNADVTTETPTGAAAKVRGGTIRNGSTFTSLFVQKKLSSSMYLQYAGAYPSRMTVTGGLGNYGTGTCDLVAKSEGKATSDGSTGAINAAPTGRVIDPVAGFVGIFWNEESLGTGIDRFTVTMENTGAASQFAMGSASAQGILTGTFTASATFRAYFKDFSLYDNVTSETAGRLAFVMQDATGKSYAFTFLSATLTNPNIVAGGPGQSVFAEFQVEGGPSGAGTLVIDRMAAS